MKQGVLVINIAIKKSVIKYKSLAKAQIPCSSVANRIFMIFCRASFLYSARIRLHKSKIRPDPSALLPVPDIVIQNKESHPLCPTTPRGINTRATGSKVGIVEDMR